MSDILKGLGPHKVFEYFETICGIPHGSGNVKAISDFALPLLRNGDSRCSRMRLIM